MECVSEQECCVSLLPRVFSMGADTDVELKGCVPMIVIGPDGQAERCTLTRCRALAALVMLCQSALGQVV